MGTHTTWTPEDPRCVMCIMVGVEKPAAVDCRMITGQWALLCEKHWEQLGMYYPELGTGKAQRIVEEV